jgi:hypothetical protein
MLREIYVLIDDVGIPYGCRNKSAPVRHIISPQKIITYSQDQNYKLGIAIISRHYKTMAVLNYTRSYMLTGVVEEEFGAVTLTVDSVRLL